MTEPLNRRFFTAPKSARLVFLGTKDFALPAFETLCDQGRDVVALITQPDKPQGRKQQIVPTRIRLAAEARSVPVHQPVSVNSDEGLGILGSYRPDLLVTVAYGQILKPSVLAIAPFGGVNLHGSLLPQYRGAAPVARSIQSGDAETGVTVISMSPQVDAGGILSAARTSIGPEDTALTLEARLALIGAPLLAETIDRYLAGEIHPVPQDVSLSTKAPKLSKDEAEIDWNLPGFLVDRFVRAMNPWPVARTWFVPGDGRDAIPVFVHDSRLSAESAPDHSEPGAVAEVFKSGIRIVCGDHGMIEPQIIQTEGRKPIPAADWARGARVRPGDKFVKSSSLAESP